MPAQDQNLGWKFLQDHYLGLELFQRSDDRILVETFEPYLSELGEHIYVVFSTETL